MIRFLADENLNGGIIRGLLSRKRDADLVRVQDIGLTGAGDPKVLEWAADHGRILITHDVSTITRFAYERLGAGLPMPGVFEVPRSVSIRQAIDDLLLVLECSEPSEWVGQVRYLPL